MKQPSARQAELDRYAARHHWERGALRSWRVCGFTVGVGTEWPKQKFHATRGDEHGAFESLDDLAAWCKKRAAIGH